MNLRLRLIAAFFLLSVVPLTAVTVYAYRNNVRAAREAARREAELLAGELSQRMQVVTGQLSERVEYLMDLADAAAAVDTAVQTSKALAATEVATSTRAASASTASETLSSISMLLNNVELRDGFRGRGRGGGGRGGAGGGRGGGFRGDPSRGDPTRGDPARGGFDPTRGDAARGAGPAPAAPVPGQPNRPPPAPPVPPPPGAPSGPPPFRGQPPPGPPAGDAADRISIDLMPIRQEILQQYASQEEFSKLSPAEQERIRGEVNQRMLGIQMGIRVGTAEAQRRIAEAQRAAELKAKEAAKAVVPVTATAPKATRKATLSGSRLDVTMERDGEVIHRANAEVDLPNLLGTVFSTTRRDRGEVPFAIAKDGRIYTPSDADKKTVEALGPAVTKVDAPTGTAMLADWIVVTIADPTGSGLKFGIARPVGDSLNELRRASARNAIFGLAIIGLALVGIVPLSSRLTKNLSTLSDGVHRIAEGDYSARVKVSSHDEVGRLAVAFNHMAEDVERHQRAAVGQERIRRELELGRQIQHEMLPQAPLKLGLTEIKGVSVPAREVGGDFFNYFQLSSGEVALLVGDVSGKGVGAALLMANIQASLRTRLALGQDLAAIAREIDVDIDANTPGSVYATLFIAMLNLTTHELRYVNAGHHSQYVLRPGGGLERMASTGLPVGLLSGYGYAEQRVQVAAGDLLFFYTDGCVEAEAESGEMFGTERLEDLLTSSALAHADDVLTYVEAEITKFRGGFEASDDATMMAVKVG